MRWVGCSGRAEGGGQRRGGRDQRRPARRRRAVRTASDIRPASARSLAPFLPALIGPMGGYCASLVSCGRGGVAADSLLFFFAFSFSLCRRCSLSFRRRLSRPSLLSGGSLDAATLMHPPRMLTARRVRGWLVHSCGGLHQRSSGARSAQRSDDQR